MIKKKNTTRTREYKAFIIYSLMLRTLNEFNVKYAYEKSRLRFIH